MEDQDRSRRLIGGSYVAGSRARASFPGRNGRIAFATFSNVFSAASNGQGLLRLSDRRSEKNRQPEWSADGKHIVFVCHGNAYSTSNGSELCMMEADGSYNQTSKIACDQWNISSDGGDTWEAWDTCTDNGETWGDHPSFATGRPGLSKTTYPNLTYFCSYTLDLTTGCRVSHDGGMTFDPHVAAITDCGGLNGFPKTAADGTVYVPRVANSDWEPKECRYAQIAVSRDEGKSWEAYDVDKTMGASMETTGDPSVAVDSAGNVYFLWIGKNHLPYLTHSRDGGRTWTKPKVVAAPGITATGLPSLAAGDDGRIAFLYMGSTVEKDFKAKGDALDSATWNAYVSFSLNALDRKPVFATTTANPLTDPIKRGDCSGRCWTQPGPGSPAGAHGSLQDGIYDFLDMEISPTTGRVWVALVDLCIDICSAPGATGEDVSQGAAAVGVQTDGSLLLEPRATMKNTR